MRHLALGIQAFAVGIEDQRSTISVGMQIGETARDHADFCRSLAHAETWTGRNAEEKTSSAAEAKSVCLRGLAPVHLA
jgi:hypothetical protein